MGLFSGSKTTIPATGFYALPTAYQNLYRGLLSDANKYLRPGGQLNVDMFTPLAQTKDETRAIEMVRAGLTPTKESLRSDIDMLTNPFDEFVIADINREAQGANSILNQAMTAAGQTGSNRSILGASDIESQRLGQIGRFRQNNYNNAVNASLGRLADLKGQDISNLMNVGGFQRGLDTATKQAPLSAINAGTGALNSFRTEFGNFGSPEQTVKSGGGFGGILGKIGGIAGTAIGGPVGGVIGGGLGGFLGSGGDLGQGLSGALRNSTALTSSLGWTGGLDPTTGINWNSGRSGGFFGGF